MADTLSQADLFNLFRDHADIRREVAVESCELGKEIWKSADAVNSDVKNIGWKVADRVGDEADRIVSQDTSYFIANLNNAHQIARDVAALKASSDMAFQKVASDIATQAALGQAATALESAKTTSAITLGQTVATKEILADNAETRKLINELKFTDLNRELMERNQALVECRSDSRNHRHYAEQSQWNAVANQLQAFNSQLQETRQGVINFGSMTGNAGRQESTSNNAR